MVPYARRSPPRCPIHFGIVDVNFFSQSITVTKSDPTSHGARSPRYLIQLSPTSNLGARTWSSNLGVRQTCIEGAPSSTWAREACLQRILDAGLILGHLLFLFQSLFLSLISWNSFTASVSVSRAISVLSLSGGKCRPTKLAPETPHTYLVIT